MEKIKVEVIQVLTTTQVEILNTSGDYGNYFKTLLDNEEAEILADKLIAIFEAKIKAIDKQFMDSLEGMPSDYPSLVLKVAKLRANLSQLTATKLEGEK